MSINELGFSTEAVAALNRRGAARLARQIIDALAESDSSAVNIRVALDNVVDGPVVSLGVVGVLTAVSAPLRSHRSVIGGVVSTSQVGAASAKVLPPPCWECRENGEPWEHDCDQCNPDGIYDRHGREKVQS